MVIGKRYLLVTVVFAAGAALPAMAGSEVPQMIEAVNKPGGGSYYGETHAWSPARATVGVGGVVTLSNHTAVEHGVEWVGGPAKPSCEEGAGKVPVGTTPATRGANWSGACTFTKPGVYTFYCTVHGPEMTGMVTVPGTPTATTGKPTEVTQTGAALGGTVMPEGNATSYYFEYHAASGPAQKTTIDSESATDFAAHPVSATLRGLSPATAYHVKLVVTYGETTTTVLGGEQDFTTPAVGAPGVTTGQAGAVTETGATLGGTVDPEGLATTYFFEYGLSTSYEHVTGTQHTGPEGAGQAVPVPVMGLSANTVYHFRLVAENASGGPVAGEDHTFTTASPPPPPPPITTVITTQPSTTAALGAISAAVPSPPGGSAPAGGGGGSVLVGGPSALKLSAGQHGSSLHGSIDVSPAGAGGRLEVALFATGASLAKAHRPSAVSVGRLLRSSLKAGVVSFAVPLTAQGKTALRRHRRLALTVRIVLTPVAGAAVTVTRSVVLRA